MKKGQTIRLNEETVLQFDGAFFKLIAHHRVFIKDEVYRYPEDAEIFIKAVLETRYDLIGS